MTRILRRTLTSPVSSVRRVMRRLFRKHARLLAIALVLSLLVTSLPPAASSTQNVSGQAGARAQQSSLPAQLYGSVSAAVTSIGSWMASFVAAEPTSTYQPVAAYITPAPPFIDAPTNLTVTAVSSTSINLSWTAPSGTVDHYVVERSQNIQGPFFFLANVTGATTKNDTTVTNLNAYLYRVRAVSNTGAVSPPSNMALGAAISFQFSSLVGQQITAQHFHDVRTAINAVRPLGNLPAESWDRANLAGLLVEANDLNEMRTALNDALTSLSIPVTAYEDPTLNVGVTLIKAIHIEQLQTRSSKGSSTSSGPIDSDSSTARLDPLNETGGGGENALSRNFNWNLPLLSLPGRAGLNLGLTLSYNSLVWTRVGNAISFDPDNGFPGPGFRLGFPVIQQRYFNSEVGKQAYLLISPDGSRTELRQVGSSNFYEAADSSHLLLDENTMVVRSTDGTQMTYAAHDGEFKCTQIKDRNGNFITISYAAAGQINTITDTLNRVITFNYINGWLDKITQVWKQGSPNQVTHDWARFEYADKTIDTNFPGLTVVGPADNTSIKTLTKVRLADNSCYEFAYTSWGQVWKVSRFDSATPSNILNYRTYDLPQTGTIAHTDCPRFTQRKDWAKYWNGDADGTTSASEEVATATFIVPVSDSWTMPDNTAASGVRAQVTVADGTLNKIYFVGAAGTDSGWKRGLVALVETHSGGAWKRKVMTTWTQDDETNPYILNPRVKETNTYDPEGNRARAEIDYGASFPLGNGMSCHLPRVVIEYAANATTKLRSTRTTYNMTTPYTERRILGLVSVRELFEGDVTGTLKAKSELFYDNENGSSSIQGTDAPVQHDNTSYTASFVTGRGNPSSAKRFNVDNLSQFTTTRTRYNTAGAVVSSKDALDHETTISYADSFSDGNNSRNTLAYPTKVTDPDGFETTSKYDFDFGAATSKRTPKPNETTNVPELQRPEQIFTYDSIGRLDEITNSVNSASARYEYPSTNRVDTFTTIQEGQGEAHSFQITDGVGRVVATATDHIGGVPNAFSGQKTIYDNMGRVFQTSNPTETTAIGHPSQWAAVGDDQTAGWLYTQQTYDWKGRPLVTTNQDLTTKISSYSGCGCAGGEVVSVKDEGTIDGGVEKRREQKTYKDILGRIVKTELLTWEGGSVYSATVNTYNVRDQLEVTKQYSGPENPANPFQQTTQTYDGFGRLHTKHLPQESLGTATTWTYNADDTVNTITDPRGAVTTQGYAGTNRGLVKTVVQTLTGKPTINLTFSYDSVGNRLSMSDQSGTATFTYNDLAQLTAESRTLGGTLYTLNYQYNLGGQLKKVTYPGNISINYGYDKVGRLIAVTGSDTLYQDITSYASAFTYRASGLQKTMTDGASRTSTVTYDARLRPASFQISGDVVNQTYEYYKDSRMRLVQNLSDDKFNRFYSYDHADRLTFATSGAGAGGASSDVPYHEQISYNAWGDTTLRMTETWSTQEFADAGTYVNGRRDGWDYEANGQIKTIDTRNYFYDAAGNRSLMTGQIWSGSNFFPTSTSQGYDGDGKKVEEVSTWPTTFTTRYLRSSVLQGEIVQETNSAGQTIRYVYLPNGTRLSTLIGFAKWKHETPGATGLYETFQSGFVNRVEFDPYRAKVGLTAPPPPDTNGGDGDLGGNHTGGSADSRFSNMANPAAGCFSVNGIDLPCTWSSFDVFEFFVWGPARAPAVSAPNPDGFRTWVPPKWNVPLRVENPFYQFSESIKTDSYSNYVPGHWAPGSSPGPFINVTFAQQTRHVINDRVLESAISTCINQLYSMFKMISFKAVSAPQSSANNDAYNGVVEIQGANGSSFKVVSDPTPPKYMIDTMKSVNARGATPLFGAPNGDNPFWTYNCPSCDRSNGDNYGRPAEKRYPELYRNLSSFFRVQIHELGAALTLIRNAYYPAVPPMANYPERLPHNNLYPQGHGDDGPAMEDCVGRTYFNLTGLKPGP